VNTPLQPQVPAEQVGAAMYERDRASQAFGIQLLEVRAGYARLQMQVRPDMINGHDLGHGGMIFLLADTAFAYACNSHNVSTVAAGCSIEFLAPTRAGDVLLAEAVEQAITGRHGVYDVRVTNQRGESVALFRGRSTQLKTRIIDTEA
jgi:acyl-CoA thioesterase